jgi:hypothetical protein
MSIRDRRNGRGFIRSGVASCSRMAPFLLDTVAHLWFSFSHRPIPPRLCEITWATTNCRRHSTIFMCLHLIFSSAKSLLFGMHVRLIELHVRSDVTSDPSCRTMQVHLAGEKK